MGYFDRVDFDEYQQFKRDVCNRLDILGKEIQLKVTDSEETARIAATNAVAAEKSVTDLAIKIEASLQELEKHKNAALLELQAVQKEQEDVRKMNGDLLSGIKSTETLLTQVAETKKTIDASATTIAGKVAEVTEYVEKSKGLPSSVEETQKLLDDCKTLSDSVKSILDYCIKKKSEVDEVYKSIYGEDVKDTKGNSEHIDGIRDELERAFSSIKEKTDRLEYEIKKLSEELTQKHDANLTEQLTTFEKLIDSSQARVKAVNDQLTGLLPGAMAEGLSAAYEKKKDDEVTSLQQSEKNFRTAIYALVATAFIPFSVDIYLLGWQAKDLMHVIKDTPSLIVAILPLYFPFLWLAYSSNKKVNLSKRLIEEYTHKAVLGKTFSGLSNQIETLQHQSEVKEELRTRLLFNVLQVSAENPGKLITDYNKSDHPLMDALEKSAKLSESVEALSKIPGLSALANKLAQKSEALFNSQAQKVQDGLNIQESMKDSSEAKSQEAECK